MSIDADAADAPSGQGRPARRRRTPWRPAGRLLDRAGDAAEVVPALVRPALRRIVPVLGTVSPAGWTMLGAAALAWTAGTVWGIVEFRLLALALVLALVFALPFALGRTAYAVTLDLAVDRVVVGERAIGRVELRNTARHALLPTRIELPVGTGAAVFPVPRLPVDGAHEEFFAVPTQRRAVVPVGPLRSVRGDALGLLRRVVRWTEPQDLHVHPRTVVLDSAATGFLRDLEGIPTRDLSASDVSFHALRGYVAGDDQRSVHWKTTARTGTLMVRQFEETRRSHLAIGLSIAPADYSPALAEEDRDGVGAAFDEFELAVSCAGSIGLQALRDGRALSVVLHGRELRGGTGRALLDQLSGVERGGPARRADAIDLARELARTAPQASIAALIVGAETAPATLRRAARQLPPGARSIAIRCVPGARASYRTLGDIDLLTLGSLDELPRAMRRATA